ncbi:MAG: GDSL-type esterase/lipase family protein, partial [Firmicutes bacterium]|nr:GDSL-type esterase/lipase family protein [Bacillota bacterium]
MKKFILMLAVILTASLFIGETNPGLSILAATTDNEQKTLVILGDSIAYGTAGILNPATPILSGGRNYGQIIEDTKGWNVINRARNSGRTRGVVDRDMIELLTGDTERALGTQADVAKADIINISIGGNDLQGINNTNQAGFQFGPNALRETVAEALDKLDGEITETPLIDKVVEYFTNNIDEIITAIREINQDALIVWFTNYVPPYHAMTGDTPITGGAWGVNFMFGTTNVQDAFDASVYIVSRINQAYADFIAANPGSFILSDAFTAFNGNPIYFNGGTMTTANADIIHPNAVGHALLAAILMETINSHFSTLLEQENNNLQNQNNNLQINNDYLRQQLSNKENNGGNNLGLILAIVFGSLALIFAGST